MVGEIVPLLMLLRQQPWMLEKLVSAGRDRGHHVSIWFSRSRGWWMRSTAGLSLSRTGSGPLSKLPPWCQLLPGAQSLSSSA